jgi:hypothetical protein
MANIAGTVSAGDTISSPAGRLGVVALKVVDFGLREFALTCAHVVAPPWSETPLADIDTPALVDGPAGSRVFGSVHDWSKLRAGFELKVDAALIRPVLSVKLSNAPLQLGDDPCHVEPSVRDFLAAHPGAGELEIFTGRGARRAIVEGFVDKEIELRRQLYFFPRVLQYRADVQPGDSGSVVIDLLTRCVIGIHFAGDAPRTGYSIPIENILSLFKDYRLTIPRT